MQVDIFQEPLSVSDKILLSLRAGAKLQFAPTNEEAAETAYAALENQGLITIEGPKPVDATTLGEGFVFSSVELTAPYQLTSRGALDADLILGKEDAEAETKFIADVLRTGLTRKTLRTSVTVDEGLSEKRADELFHELAREGYLAGVAIDRGLFSVQAFTTTVKGERELDRMEGRDSEAFEKSARGAILLEFIDDKGEVGSITILSPTIKGLGIERLAFLTKDLVEKGLIAHTYVNQGMSRVVAYELTGRGREVLDGMLRATVTGNQKARFAQPGVAG